MRRTGLVLVAVVATAVGVGLGLWMAQPNYDCPPARFALQNNGLCPPLFPEPRFVWWLCALCGAAAAALIALVSVGVRRSLSS